MLVKPVYAARSVRAIAVTSMLALVVACGGQAATNPPTQSASNTGAPGTTAPAGSPAASASPTFEAQPGAVTLVGYTTPREVYEEVIPMFQATEAGADVQFEESYGGSGDQSRAVEAGLPADVLALSLWPDINRLVEPGIVAEDWYENEHEGIVSNSVVALAFRPGNPKNIQGWDDLVRDDISVVTPNPFTSGGAQWNLLAAYQAQIVQGKSEDEAYEFLKAVIANTDVMDRSAREALTTFAAGQGDVLIAYENEAIFAKNAGEQIEWIVPDQTILIENPIAVTLTGDAAEAAQAFVDFTYTLEAQTVYASKGYRPEIPEAAAAAGVTYPDPAELFTIADMGGWPEARPRFFDTEDGLVAQIFVELNREI